MVYNTIIFIWLLFNEYSTTTIRADGEGANQTDDSEVEVSYLVMVIQVSLATLFIVVAYGWIHLTINAVLTLESGVTEYFWALSAILQ